MSEYILAGDIGGTKTNLGIYTFNRHGELACLVDGSYSNRESASIEDIIRRFLDMTEIGPVRQACFGVAGAVQQGVCTMSNLGWRLDERALAKNLDLQRVALLNDLVTTAYGISTLPADKLVTLNAGKPDAGGNMALIAAGTGLGEAILVHTDHGLHISASEGGHADFAPRDEDEIELWRYLASKFGHVSVERLVSGPGLYNIYAFLRDSGRLPEPEWLRARIATASDASAVIASQALRKECPLCEAAMHRFVSIYGAAAGNLALRSLATGGLYIGGGIAPKILEALSDGNFIAIFQDKGRFSQLLSSMPVKVILEPKTALLGAAAYISGQPRRKE